MVSKLKRNNDGIVKPKHVSLTILQKVELIKKLKSGSSVKFLATKFDTGDHCIQY